MDTSTTTSIQALESEAPPATMKSIHSPLLRLPLELRRLIFWYSLFWNRSITPEEYYIEQTSGQLPDEPSPLLRASKQTRGEAFDLLQDEQSFTIRMSPFGGSFDSLSLSCLIAQKRLVAIRGLPELTVEIWAPSPERRLEIIYLWRKLRVLCWRLREKTRIPKFTIRFVESSLAQWRIDGEKQCVLNDGVEPCDVLYLCTMFSVIYGSSEVCIELPRSFEDDTRAWADVVIATMKKTGPHSGMMGFVSCTEFDFQKRMERARKAAAEWGMEESDYFGEEDVDNEGSGKGGASEEGTVEEGVGEESVGEEYDGGKLAGEGGDGEEDDSGKSADNEGISMKGGDQ